MEMFTLINITVLYVSYLILLFSTVAFFSSLSLLLFPAQNSLSFFHGYFYLATSALLSFTETI